MLDTYDTHNSDHPANKKELPPLTELEQAEEYNRELKQKLMKAKKQLQECIELSEEGTNSLLTNKLKKIRL